MNHARVEGENLEPFIHNSLAILLIRLARILDTRFQSHNGIVCPHATIAENLAIEIQRIEIGRSGAAGEDGVGAVHPVVFTVPHLLDACAVHVGGGDENGLAEFIHLARKILIQQFFQVGTVVTVVVRCEFRNQRPLSFRENGRQVVIIHIVQFVGRQFST